MKEHSDQPVAETARHTRAAAASQKQAAPQDHFRAIRGHITELSNSGDDALKRALAKIVIRLDRIEGKS